MSTTTVRLTAAQVPYVREILLYDLPDEGLDYADSREQIVKHLEATSLVLERLDRLGWDDTDDRDYTDEPVRLADIAARLIDRGADQNNLGGEGPFEEAARRRRQVEPALAGVAIFDQLDLPQDDA